jgi:predicted MFS family arabinose efflux permease
MCVLAPGDLLQEASALSRLAMNAAQMSGAAVAGLVVAAIGPGWALTVCGAGVTFSIPLLLSIRARPAPSPPSGGMLRDMRDGWSEFISHTWLWVICGQFCIVMMAWFGGFEVLGPVVAKEHLGGPVARGAIMAAQSVGLVAGGLVSLRWAPRRPMLTVVTIGAIMGVTPLSLAMLWPLPLICLTSFGVGAAIEIMMVVWTVTMARNIRPGTLARVSGYDALASMMATPAGALIAGPAALAIGVRRTQYSAAAIIVAVSGLALIPRDVRRTRTRAGEIPPGEAVLAGEPVPDTGAITAGSWGHHGRIMRTAGAGSRPAPAGRDGRSKQTAPGGESAAAIGPAAPVSRRRLRPPRTAPGVRSSARWSLR